MSNSLMKPTPEKTAEGSRAITVAPRVDILEMENEILVLADMPGVSSDHVDIRFENGELSIHGRREVSHGEKTRAAWEYDVTNYFRTFRVTEKIAADKIEADLKNGVLTLKLPKVEAVKPRKIPVRG